MINPLTIFISSPGIVREILFVTIAICVAILANSFLRYLIKVPKRLETRRGKIYVAVMRNVLTLIICYITLHVILVIVGINITPLLASAGVIGIIVGIGAQSTVKDLLGGFFLISQSSIAIGDYINVGINLEGTVKSIGLKNLSLVSPNGTLIIVPNGQVNTIINYTYGRANTPVDILITGKVKIDGMLDIFHKTLQELRKDKKYIIYPESHIVGVTSIDVNGITVSTLLTTPYSLRGSIEPEFRYRILKEFEKRKISER